MNDRDTSQAPFEYFEFSFAPSSPTSVIQDDPDAAHWPSEAQARLEDASPMGMDGGEEFAEAALVDGNAQAGPSEQPQETTGPIKPTKLRLKLGPHPALLKPKRVQKSWTHQEDKMLLDYAEKNPEASWGETSKALDIGRDTVSCRRRWIILNDEKNVKAKAAERGIKLEKRAVHSVADDAKLLTAADVEGEFDLSALGLTLDYPLTGEACANRIRWLQKMPKTADSSLAQPTRRGKTWSLEDDQKLLEAVPSSETAAIDWLAISTAIFNGERTALGCQSRVRTLRDRLRTTGTIAQVETAPSKSGPFKTRNKWSVEEVSTFLTLIDFDSVNDLQAVQVAVGAAHDGAAILNQFSRAKGKYYHPESTTTRSRPDADFIGPLVSLDRAPWSDAELAKLRDFIDTKGSRRPGGIDKLQLALDSSRSTDCIKLELKGLKSSESVGILEGDASTKQLSNTPYTLEEESRLLQLASLPGRNDWLAISNAFGPSRSANSLNQHFRRLKPLYYHPEGPRLALNTPANSHGKSPIYGPVISPDSYTWSDQEVDKLRLLGGEDTTRKIDWYWVQRDLGTSRSVDCIVRRHAKLHGLKSKSVLKPKVLSGSLPVSSAPAPTATSKPSGLWSTERVSQLLTFGDFTKDNDFEAIVTKMRGAVKAEQAKRKLKVLKEEHYHPRAYLAAQNGFIGPLISPNAYSWTKEENEKLLSLVEDSAEVPWAFVQRVMKTARSINCIKAQAQKLKKPGEETICEVELDSVSSELTRKLSRAPSRLLTCEFAAVGSDFATERASESLTPVGDRPTPLTYDLDDDDDQSMIDEYEQYEQYEQYDDCGEFEATMDDQETGSINGETFNAIMEEQQSHIKTDSSHCFAVDPSLVAPDQALEASDVEDQMEPQSIVHQSASEYAKYHQLHEEAVAEASLASDCEEWWPTIQLTSQEREEALSCVWPTSFNFPLVQPTATHKRFRSEEVEETDDQQMGSASKRPRLEVIEEVNGAD